MSRLTKILIVLLCAFGFMTAPAMGDSGQPLMYPLGNGDGNLAKAELISLINESLTVDPEGNAFIRGSTCTTPRDFMLAITTFHSNVRIDAPADLPGYIHSLEVRSASEIGSSQEYPMSRMICATPGAGRTPTDHIDLEGFGRSFSLGEYVLFDPNIGEVIIAANCSNVTGRAPEEFAAAALVATAPLLEEARWYDDCILVPVRTRVGSMYQWAYFHNRPIPAETTQNCRVLCEGVLTENSDIRVNMSSCIRVPRPCTRCRWSGLQLQRGYVVQDSAQWSALYPLTMVGISRADAERGGYWGLCGYNSRFDSTGVPLFDPDELSFSAQAGAWSEGIVEPIWDGISVRVGNILHTIRRGRHVQIEQRS